VEEKRSVPLFLYLGGKKGRDLKASSLGLLGARREEGGKGITDGSFPFVEEKREKEMSRENIYLPENRKKRGEREPRAHPLGYLGVRKKKREI